MRCLSCFLQLAVMRNPLLSVTIIVVLVILLCESLFGLFSRYGDPMRSPDHYGHFADGECMMLVEVAKAPTHGNNSLKVNAEVLAVADSNGIQHPCHGKMLLFMPFDADTLVAGDRLLLCATPRQPSPPNNPHQFNYRFYLRQQNITHTAYVKNNSFRVVAHSDKGLRHFFDKMRMRLVATIQSSRLSASSKGIAENMLLGWDDDMQEETQDNFRRSGIAHLLCVSGLHVGIIALLVSWPLLLLGNKRKMKIIRGCIQIAVLWLFAAITGMAPSTCRAALMFSFISIGQMFYAKPPTLNAIAASALLLLIWRPLLLFNIGFQLSYSAVCGIVIFTEPLSNLIPLPEGTVRWKKIAAKILARLRSLFCVSLVAQLSTMPFSLYYFHQFPPYFLVANMVIVPCAFVLMLTIIILLVSSFWPALFNIIGIVLNGELTAVDRITSAIASWPHSMIEDIYFDTPMLAMTLVMTCLIAWMTMQRNKKLIITVLFVSLILIVYAVIRERQSSNQMHCDIYSVGRRTAIEFFAGHTSYLICDKATAENPKAIDFQTKDNRIYRQCRSTLILPADTAYEDANILVDNYFIMFNGTSYRIVNRNNRRELSEYVIHIDKLLLCDNPYVTVAELRKRYDFDTLVITSSNSQSYVGHSQEECDSLSVPYIIRK